MRSGGVRRVVALLFGYVALAAAAHAQAPDITQSDTIKRVKASIVAIGTYQAARAPAFRFRGTGFAVGDGHVVATNAHVLSAPVDEANLEKLVVAQPLGDGRIEVQDARTLASDAAHDLALLRIAKPLPALSLGDARSVREGRDVRFTGFPIGMALGLHPATHRAMVAAITPIAIPLPDSGHLSAAVVRRLAGERFPVFQLDAIAYPGNSGSPLYDPATGAVLGIINMAFIKETKEAVLTQPSGITYAIPVEHLRELLTRAAAR